MGLFSSSSRSYSNPRTTTSNQYTAAGATGISNIDLGEGATLSVVDGGAFDTVERAFGTFAAGVSDITGDALETVQDTNRRAIDLVDNASRDNRDFLGAVLSSFNDQAGASRQFVQSATQDALAFAANSAQPGLEQSQETARLVLIGAVGVVALAVIVRAKK